MENVINETELLLQLAEGDQDAFATLLCHYRDHVFQHALMYVKSYEQAEEIVQDIFLKVWTHREKMKEVDSFRNYLFILGKNHLISTIRKKVAVIARLNNESLEEVLLVPDQQLDTKETHHLILKGIEHLSPQQKQVFTLSRFEDLNHEQIAQRLNISKRTVKFHMLLALEHLRKYLRFHAAHLLILIAGWIRY